MRDLFTNHAGELPPHWQAVADAVERAVDAAESGRRQAKAQPRGAAKRRKGEGVVCLISWETLRSLTPAERRMIDRMGSHQFRPVEIPPACTCDHLPYPHHHTPEYRRRQILRWNQQSRHRLPVPEALR